MQLNFENIDIKKVLIGFIGVLVVVLTILVAYNVLFNKEEEELTKEEEEETPTTNENIVAISEDPVMGITIDGQKVKYYLKSNGHVIQSSLDGSSSTKISSFDLSGLSKIVWSPDSNKVISIFYTSGKTSKSIYDYTTKSSFPLNKNVQWVGWSPSGDRIAYQYYDSQSEESNSISIADPTGTQWTSILQTRMKDLVVEWPSTQEIAISTKPSGLAQSVVYTINLNTNQFKKVINETFGLTTLWSPQGDKILYSETNNKGTNLKLKLLDLTTDTTFTIDLITLSEKCVWSQDNRTVFCAVPALVPGSAVFPDDYYKQYVAFNDSVWRINLDTGEMTEVSATTEYDMTNLILSPLEDYLLFINQKDGLLYSLSL